jgi:hypothetical protein
MLFREIKAQKQQETDYHMIAGNAVGRVFISNTRNWNMPGWLLLYRPLIPSAVQHHALHHARLVILRAFSP